MTLADLIATLQTRAALPASRLKDCKTSLRYLAYALGSPALDQCPVDAACQKEATWTGALDTHFRALEAQGRTISAATRRNTRNNCRVVLRLAEAHGLMPDVPLPPRLLLTRGRKDFERQQRATAPYQTTYHPTSGPRRFGLPQAQWPPDITQGWQAYQARCGLRVRATTFQFYTNALATYLGYLAHICGRTPTWDDVFDVAQITAFIRWHATRLQRPITVHGRHVVLTAAAMASVLKHPASRALADLRKTLPMPAPLHTKRHHWVSLRELEAVGDACLVAGRVPVVVQKRVRYPGARRAVRFQRGVILKLLVRVPLRQRNVRELRLEEHLYKDPAGRWWLHFSGSDLKIGTRQGRVNEYRVNLTDYCPDFIATLEEFLQVHRPRLPGSAASPLLFLTHSGKPYTVRSLRAELSDAVAMHTGQRFYPHLIRTIWATEYLEKTQDFTGAAVLLGDTVAVVMKTYHDVVNRDYHAKARAFLGGALQG
jgi:hypothetical protein